MLTITTINYIRELYFVEGKTFTEIEKMTQRNYRTIKKYIEMEDFNEKTLKREKANRSDSIKPIIKQWITEDKFRHHKQRHTAKRVYDRLVEEYPDLLDVTDRTVRSIVKEIKETVFGSSEKPYLRLEHPGGEAQVDFGSVDVFENGVKKRFHELILSFPKSNAGFALLTRSETREALLEGLANMFSFIGFVPSAIWFDQMSTAALRTRDEKGLVQTTDFVKRFATHYGFAIKFCNPNSGNEKGNVERMVGTIRRNLFVPEPKITDLNSYNQHLLGKCLKLNQEKHYIHKVPKEQLFEAEKALMVSINPVPFDTAKYETRKVNKYGLVEYAKCRYSVSPKYVGQYVMLKITADQIHIYSKDLSKSICRHKRLFEENSESIHHVDFIDMIKLRPNALKYSGIYSLLPDTWQRYLESIDKNLYKDAFDVLRNILLEDDMAYADKVLKETLRHHLTSPEAISITYRRFKENMDIYDTAMTLPQDLPAYDIDISHYDLLMGKYALAKDLEVISIEKRN